MLLSVGTKVRLKYTGDEGEVVTLFADGMVAVRLDADHSVIPVDSEALEDVTKPKRKIIQPKQPSKKEAQRREISSQAQHSFLYQTGIGLAFEPNFDYEGNATSYRIFLINDSSTPIVYDIKFSLLGDEVETFNGKLDTSSLIELDELLYDELNDSPSFDIECSRITTMGLGKPLYKTVKIKAKQFFAKVKTVALLNRTAHYYSLFEKIEEAEKSIEKKSNNSLQQYTKMNTKKAAPKSKPKKFDIVKEYTEFSTELDLHIEKLAPNPERMTPGDKLHLQLTVFDDYMDKAIRIGVERVFIIHGVGNGILKREVTKRLKDMAYVVKHKNEFHSAYGYGATEVWL